MSVTAASIPDSCDLRFARFHPVPLAGQHRLAALMLQLQLQESQLLCGIETLLLRCHHDVSEVLKRRTC
jgi:hypothetical protein